MFEQKCKHCGRGITEYRGAWFSSGDTTRCGHGGQQHEPTEPTWKLQARAAGWAPSSLREQLQALLDKHGAAAVNCGGTLYTVDQIVALAEGRAP